MGLKKYLINYEFVSETIENVFNEFVLHNNYSKKNIILLQFKEDINFRIQSMTAKNTDINTIPERIYNNIDVLVDKYGELTKEHPEKISQERLKILGYSAITGIISRNKECLLKLKPHDMEKKYNISSEIMSFFYDNILEKISYEEYYGTKLIELLNFKIKEKKRGYSFSNRPNSKIDYLRSFFLNFNINLEEFMKES